MPSIRAVLAAAAGAASIFASLAAAAPSKSPIDLNKRTTKFAYGSEKVRGVNLGGWLVLEPWITPSIFSSQSFVDEYTMGEVLGPQEGFSVLTKHWETWITEADFAKIASLGLNHVRIPIGYWSIVPIPGNPHVVGAYQYLGKAITWAQNHGLKVMIDLHGAPGSQNGFDNSGRRGGIHWTQNQSLQRTHAALNRLRDDHASSPAVSTIELVNEPMGPQLDRNVLEGFYYDGYGDLAGSDVAVTFQDAFEGVNDWNDFGHYLPDWVQDTHHYQVFTADFLKLDGPGHVRTACEFGGQMRANNKPTIAGEFTGAMTDCTKWLNGLGEGARFEGSYNYEGQTSYFIGGCDGLRGGTVASLDPTYRENVGKFVEAQMDAFESAAGWIFWTWKTEQSPDWDFQALSDAGVIPTPVTNRNHPGQCS